MKIYLAVGFLFMSVLGFAQSQIDSLENLLSTSSGTNRNDVLTQLGYKLFYKDPVKADHYARVAMAEAEVLDYPSGMASGLYIRGIIHDIAGNRDSSEYFFTKGYKISKKHQLTYLEGSGLNNLGMMNWNLSKYNKALEYFLEALRVYELDENEKGISKAISNIGLIYQELNQYDKALGFNFRSLKLRLQSDNKDHIARSYNNIGICFRNLQQSDSAIHYFKLGLEYAALDESKEVEGSIYDNLANVYNDQNDHQRAIEYHLLSLTMRQPGSQARIANHANLSSLYFEIGDYALALENALTADSIMRSNNSPNLSVENYFNLANAYLHFNQKDSALRYFEKWRKISEEVFGETSSKAVAEMQTKYETEKKEQQLALLETERQLQEAELEESRIVILLITVLSIVIFIAIILHSSRKRYKLKESLAVEREQLQRNRFKTVIEAEEKERKRIAQELHDGLGQLLSTARINVSGVGDADDRKVRNSLALIDQSIDEVRSISHNLMPNALIAVGLKSALDGLVGNINASDQVKINVKIDGELLFGEAKSIGIYRVIQEVINNALKYADSPRIDFTATTTNLVTEFVVRDHGAGFDTDLIHHSKGIGWSSIFSRVDLMGGRIDVFSMPNQGTTVKVSIPQDMPAKHATAV